MKSILKGVGLLLLGSALLSGCAAPYLPEATRHENKAFNVGTYEYLIGPGDLVNVLVWRNPEVSGSYRVKPDGRITLPLLGDVSISGKTTVEVSGDLGNKFEAMLNGPQVTVTVDEFSGYFSEQVKVVGAAATPQAINYSKNMTLLDVMIVVGGLTKYADGNGAILIRNVNDERKEYSLAIGDLIKRGELSANVDILPGDVIVIPEAWF